MKPQLPKISIVTPSYNQAEFLEATIESVLSQNYPNLEYIIIDGGSTDTSLDIIKRYEKHLHYWCSEPDLGQYDAINKGFSHSTGEIMSWLNSDDMYFLWTFKTVASIMLQFHEVEWLTTLNAGWWDRQGCNTGFTPLPGFSKEAFLDGRYIPWSHNQRGWIQQESTFWKRSLWEKAGSSIDRTYALAGDFDLWGRFYKYADLYATPSALGGFRSHDNQRSSQKQSYINEARQSLNAMRTIEGWKGSMHKDLIYKLRLNKIPKIKNMSLSASGYIGKRIVRKNAGIPGKRWNIENYRFL